LVFHIVITLDLTGSLRYEIVDTREEGRRGGCASSD
jgi:hypothetical protein